MKTHGAQNFIENLYTEKILHKTHRHEYVLKKLFFTLSLFSVGTFSKLGPLVHTNLENTLHAISNLLYIVPFVSLAFDIYIYSEDFKIKRIGKFIIERCRNVRAKEEENWERWLRVPNNRESMASKSSFFLTLLTFAVTYFILLLNTTETTFLDIWGLLGLIVINSTFVIAAYNSKTMQKPNKLIDVNMPEINNDKKFSSSIKKAFYCVKKVLSIKILFISILNISLFVISTHFFKSFINDIRLQLLTIIPMLTSAHYFIKFIVEGILKFNKLFFSQSTNGKFRIDNKYVQGGKVCVAGEFNNWQVKTKEDFANDRSHSVQDKKSNKQVYLMKEKASKGIYTCEIPNLELGQHYEYLFYIVAIDEWIPDPDCDWSLRNPFGGENSLHVAN